MLKVIAKKHLIQQGGNMKVTAWISDYSRRYFKIVGTLRKSKGGGFCIDLGNDGDYVFPLAHRNIEVFDESGNRLHKYSGMRSEYPE